MPFFNADDPSLPERVKEFSQDKREKWVAVWNSAYRGALEDGKSESEAEEIAFRTANGTVSKYMEPFEKFVDKLESLSDRLEHILNVSKSGEDPEEIFVQKELDETFQIVYGVVLEPDSVDAQGDRISKEEIFKAMHNFMVEQQKINLQHTPIDVPSVIVENFVAPVDMKIGDDVIKAGSWVMGVKILDDGLWESVQKGDFTGFSIEGKGKRTPIQSD